MAELLLFATVKEKLQQDKLVIDPSIRTISHLRDWLIEEYPQVEDDLGTVIWAKNEEYVELTEPISEGDIIAIIAPVSGG